MYFQHCTQYKVQYTKYMDILHIYEMSLLLSDLVGNLLESKMFWHFFLKLKLWLLRWFRTKQNSVNTAVI